MVVFRIPVRIEINRRVPPFIKINTKVFICWDPDLIYCIYVVLSTMSSSMQFTVSSVSISFLVSIFFFLLFYKFHFKYEIKKEKHLSSKKETPAFPESLFQLINVFNLDCIDKTICIEIFRKKMFCIRIPASAEIDTCVTARQQGYYIICVVQ